MPPLAKLIGMRSIKLATGIAMITLLTACGVATFQNSDIDSALRMSEHDGVDTSREQIIKIGEVLCEGRSSTPLDELLPDRWAYSQKAAVVENVSIFMCDGYLAEPSPKDIQKGIFPNKVWEVYQRTEPAHSGLDRQQVEGFSEGICDFYADGMHVGRRVDNLQIVQNRLMEEAGKSEFHFWTHGDAILIDRAIVEEVCERA